LVFHRVADGGNDIERSDSREAVGYDLAGTGIAVTKIPVGVYGGKPDIGGFTEKTS
jgi:hypothetical protein